MTTTQTTFPRSAVNPTGLRGIDFIEFTSPASGDLETLFESLGFTWTMTHASKRIAAYQQGDITFLINREPGSFAAKFCELHGPSICSMGWRTERPTVASQRALDAGAVPARSDLVVDGVPVPAIEGVGGSQISFVDDTRGASRWARLGFLPLESPKRIAAKGFLAVDHLTNNVERGTMSRWANFYKSVFGFEEVRTFDIRGEKTGLSSYALRSPCGTFCIPINEADEARSQINEYIEMYHGAGIQHVALLTEDIVQSLRKLDGSGVGTLDIDEPYYRAARQKFPQVTEPWEELQRRNVLVDGDERGYLLQLFTQNVIGPIFFELIQRKNHASFGEGNFGALFRSIERDQQRRGVFDGAC